MSIRAVVGCAAIVGFICARGLSSSPHAPGMGYVLLKDGILLRAEAVPDRDGYFLRDYERGERFDARRVLAIFTPEYYDLIAQRSPMAAAWESIYLMSAGQRFIWNPDSRYSFQANDKSVRILKATLLMFTGIFYYRAAQKNRDVGKSMDYVNAAPAKAKFAAARDRYYGLLALTTTVFAWQAYLAYARFGHDIHGNNLLIKGPPALQLKEFMNRPSSLPQQSPGEPRVVVQWHVAF